MSRATNHDELKIQREVVRLLSASGYLVFSIPNELLHFLPMFSRERYVKAGLHKGAPDLVVVGNGLVLFVELKTKTGRQSPEQSKFEYELTRRGAQYTLWKSIQPVCYFQAS
jgi:hypothetical protein